jgi:hypothetical protein
MALSFPSLFAAETTTYTRVVIGLSGWYKLDDRVSQLMEM